MEYLEIYMTAYTSSYLSERSQFAEFQNIQSDTKPITHGVP